MNVSDGTIIKAVIEGNDYIATTPAIYGNATYAIEIVPPDGVQYMDGTQIAFYIGNITAAETGIWETGGNFRLDLSAIEPAICGDATGNGKVTVSDGRRIFLHILDPDTYPIVNPWAADVTGNGKITVSDGRRIFLHILDPDTYPLECT
jgi:hypothetical protein